jgi:hypothetical protein
MAEIAVTVLQVIHQVYKVVKDVQVNKKQVRAKSARGLSTLSQGTNEPLCSGSGDAAPWVQCRTLAERLMALEAPLTRLQASGVRASLISGG